MGMGVKKALQSFKYAYINYFNCSLVRSRATGVGAEIQTGPGVEAQKVGTKELLLLEEAYRGTTASSLSQRLANGGFWRRLQ